MPFMKTFQIELRNITCFWNKKLSFSLLLIPLNSINQLHLLHQKSILTQMNSFKLIKRKFSMKETTKPLFWDVMWVNFNKKLGSVSPTIQHWEIQFWKLLLSMKVQALISMKHHLERVLILTNLHIITSH